MEIFDAAVAVAKRVGFRNITAKDIGAEVGKSRGWVRQHVSIIELRRQLEARAAELGLQPGDMAQTPRCFRGDWTEQRKAAVLAAAVDLAERDGLMQMRRDAIAQRAGVAGGTLNLYFGTLADLRNAVVAEAIRLERWPVVLMAHSHGFSVPDDARRKAAQAIA